MHLVLVSRLRAVVIHMFGLASKLGKAKPAFVEFL